MTARLPDNPEFSASVFRDEVDSHCSHPCAYSTRGCREIPLVFYSIGAGLTHPGGEAYLYACAEHDEDISKHAQNIVRLIMLKMKRERQKSADGGDSNTSNNH